VTIRSAMPLPLVLLLCFLAVAPPQSVRACGQPWADEYVTLGQEDLVLLPPRGTSGLH